MKELNELIRLFDDWAKTCEHHQKEFGRGEQAEYHRGAREAFERCRASLVKFQVEKGAALAAFLKAESGDHK